MNLNFCLRKYKLDDSLAKRMRLLAQEYQAQGNDAQAAQTMAADDILTELQDERDDILQQIRDKGGVPPGEEIVEEAPTAEPQAEPVQEVPEEAPMQAREEPEAKPEPSSNEKIRARAVEVRSKLADEFGESGIANLERMGILKIVNSIDDLPARIRWDLGEKVVDPLFADANLLSDLGIRKAIGPQGQSLISIPLDALSDLKAASLESRGDIGRAGTEGGRDLRDGKAALVKGGGATDVVRGGTTAARTITPTDKSSGLEGAPDGAPMKSAKGISDFLVGSAALPHLKRLAEIPSKRLRVDSGVVLNSDQLKIVDGVIKSIPIDMMNVFVSGKGPANVPFHNQPMFSLLPGSLVERIALPQDVAGPALSVNSSILRHEGFSYDKNNLNATKGVFDPIDQTGYIIANNSNLSTVGRILIHEIGEHFSLRGMLKADLHSAVLNDVRRMIETSTDAKFNAAVKHVRDNYSLDETSNAFAKEVIARYAEDPGNAPWWKKLLSDLRQFLFKLGITKELNEQDLAFMVQKALRKTMRGEIQKYGADGETMQAVSTDTDAFRRWFDDSKVVDANGKPLVVYHGTASDVAAFSDEFAKGERALFFTDDSVEAGSFAGRAARGRGGDNVMPVFLSLTNPLVVDMSDSREMSFDKIIRQAKRAGHDGVIARNANDTAYPQPFAYNDVYIAFRPEQIKSAIGNRGTFDPNSPNILQSRGEEALPEQTRFQKVQRVIQDKFNRWTQAQDYIEKASGGKLSFRENVVEKATLFPGRVQADYDMVSKKYIDPIVDLLKKNNVTMATFDKFNRAMHAPERNAAIFKINPDADPNTNPGSGMLDATTKATDENARKFIASFSEKERQTLMRANNLLVEMNKWRLTRQLEAGLISQGEYDVLTKKYQHYVPLKTIEDPDDVVDGLGSVGYMVRGKEYKQALGRSSEATSPFVVSIMDVTRSIMRTEKQEVGKSLLALARNPDARSLMTELDPKSLPEQFQIKKLYKVREMKDGKAIVRDGKPVYKEQVRYGIDPSYPSAENVIVVKENGEPKYVLVNDALMAQQFKNLNEEQLNGALEAMNKATTGIGALFTRYNPAFVPINFARDLLTVAINSLGVPGLSPSRIFAGTFESMPAIFSVNFGDGTGPLTDEYKQFLSDGATIGGLGLKSLTDLQKEMQEKGLSLTGEQTALRQAYGNIKSGLDFISRANEVVENGTRFSVYRNAREVFYKENTAKGMKPEEAMGDARQRAAVLAREISVDFNKRGEYSRAFNSMYMFFNAAVQGLRSFFKFSIASPQANRVQMALLGLMGAGVAARLFNHAVGGWDDDLDQPAAIAFEGSAATSVPLVFGDKVVKIPLPYVFNIPFVIGYRLTDASITGRVGFNIGEIFKTAYGALSPLGEPEQAKTAFGAAVKFVTPSAFSPIADIVDNSNRFGKPIYKAAPPWDKAPPPMAYNHFNSASEASQALAQMLNWASGGTRVEPGGVNLSPDMLDHIASYYAGGPGRFLMQGWDLLANGQDPLDAPPPSQYPILGRVWSEAKPEWYPSVEFGKLQKEMAYIDKAVEAGEKVEPQMRAINAQFNSANKQLEQLYRQIRQARNKKDEAAEKRLDEQIYKIKERAVRQYNIGTGRYAEAMKGTTREDAAAMFRQAGKPAMANVVSDTLQ